LAFIGVIMVGRLGMTKHKKHHHQKFDIKRHPINTVGRLGGGQSISGIPWYSLYYGVGFGGYGGYYGNGYGEQGESSSQEAAEQNSGEETGENGASDNAGSDGAGSGDGGGAM
jgi:hypothetical protein